MSTETGKENENNKGNSGFLLQGAILAASGIISSLIGLMYRLPLTRIIGDEGNGYYSAAYNVYTIILLLSSYSLPLAVSKMVSARIGRNSPRNAKRILNASLGYATLVGGAGFLIIWFGAGWFADSFLKMHFAMLPLRALAPTVWIVSYLGVLRGYYQGHSTMVPTALSQIIEQIVNALVSVGAAFLLVRFALRSGLTGPSVRSMGAMGGTIGTGAGALSALIMFLALYALTAKKRKKALAEDKTFHVESYSEITQVLFMTVVPVILSTAIYNMSGILDSAIFGHAMAWAGLMHRTAADYGIYTAKYKLLINVPVSIANSMSSSLIPALSRAHAARDRKQVDSSISMAVRFAMIVAIPSAVGMAVMAGPIIDLLFGPSPKAVEMMRFGAWGVIFYSLSTVTNAVLQGTSHMRVPVRHALLSMAIHVVILGALLTVFRMGIFGVVAADMAFALCMCILNARSIKNLLTYRQEWRRTFLLPAFCAAVMGLVTFCVKELLRHTVRIRLAGTVLPILAAIAVYAVLLVRTGCLNESELRRFPKGASLVRLFKKLHLL